MENTLVEKEGKPESADGQRDSAKSGNWRSLRMEEDLWWDWLSVGETGKGQECVNPGS